MKPIEKTELASNKHISGVGLFCSAEMDIF